MQDVLQDTCRSFWCCVHIMAHVFWCKMLKLRKRLDTLVICTTACRSMQVLNHSNAIKVHSLDLHGVTSEWI